MISKESFSKHFEDVVGDKNEFGDGDVGFFILHKVYEKNLKHSEF